MKSILSTCLLAILFVLPLSSSAQDRKMKEFNFPLFRGSITNSTIFATAAQRANGATEVLPNSILVAGGQIRTTNGSGAGGMYIFVHGSINGGDWVTNAYTITNFAISATSTNSWTAIVATNIPYRYISISGFTTSYATAVLVPYVSGLWVPWERP